MTQTTKVFKNGNSQAVRIPSNLAYDRMDLEVEIEKIGQEIRIRPSRRSLSKVLQRFSKFSKNLMENGRDTQEQVGRDKI